MGCLGKNWYLTFLLWKSTFNTPRFRGPPQLGIPISNYATTQNMCPPFVGKRRKKPAFDKVVWRMILRDAAGISNRILKTLAPACTFFFPPEIIGKVCGVDLIILVVLLSLRWLSHSSTVFPTFLLFFCTYFFKNWSLIKLMTWQTCPWMKTIIMMTTFMKWKLSLCKCLQPLLQSLLLNLSNWISRSSWNSTKTYQMY